MNIETLSEKLHSNIRFRIAAHLLFWSVIFAISWYTTVISFNPYNNFSPNSVVLLALSGTINQILVYYPLVYYVLPCLFKQRKYIKGALSVLALLMIYTLINTLSESYILMSCNSCMQALKTAQTGYYEFLQKNVGNRMFGKVASLGIFFGLVFSIAIPLSIKFSLQAFRQQLESVRLAKQNVELEFNFLKSQVNPHFLFNSLNNIYGLILKKENEKAAGIVARLSEFMRYTLYNSGGDKMPLEMEVKLLRDYIELESIRLNHTKVNTEIEIDDLNFAFPSLLLMPVVENAFKYCDDSKTAYINIKLVLKDRKVLFSAENTVDDSRQLQPVGGIGLQNLKKRLALYFPEKHQYRISSRESVYSAQLEIDL